MKPEVISSDEVMDEIVGRCVAQSDGQKCKHDLRPFKSLDSVSRKRRHTLTCVCSCDYLSLLPPVELRLNIGVSEYVIKAGEGHFYRTKENNSHIHVSVPCVLNRKSCRVLQSGMSNENGDYSDAHQLVSQECVRKAIWQLSKLNSRTY